MESDDPYAYTVARKISSIFLGFENGGFGMLKTVEKVFSLNLTYTVCDTGFS
jgi:hypothetical protein